MWKCDEEYIGETGDMLSHRMTIYRQHIRHSKVRKLFVSEHIANCAMGLDYFKIFPLYKTKTGSSISRKLKESYFIDLSMQKLNRTF